VTAAAKREVAEAFEVMHEAVVESRGPVPIKPKGKGRSRPIIVTDADGRPKRIATHDRLLEGLLEREGVEAVVEGKRPRVVRCVDCRGPIEVKQKASHLPARCPGCLPAHRRELGRAQRAKNIEREREKGRRFAKTDKGRATHARYLERNRDRVLASRRANHAANPERERERSAKYHAEHRDAILPAMRERERARRAADPDAARAKGRESYAKNRERTRARLRERWAENREDINAKRRADYARKKAEREAAKAKEQTS